jgi:hypothetical protein
MMKIRLVAATVSALFVSVAATSEELPGACNVRGEVIQWVADYCMLKMQTDDEIAVSDCIAENQEKAFPTECAAKIHYKKTMCGLFDTTGNSAEAIDRCVLDPNAMGRTVQHGGVGG